MCGDYKAACDCGTLSNLKTTRASVIDTWCASHGIHVLKYGMYGPAGKRIHARVHPSIGILPSKAILVPSEHLQIIQEESGTANPRPLEDKLLHNGITHENLLTT